MEFFKQVLFKLRKYYEPSNIRTITNSYLLPFIISITLPAVLLIYISLILSIPLLQSPVWIPDFVYLLYFSIYGALVPATFYNLTKEGELPNNWYNYIAELNASVFVLTFSLGLILFEVGSEPFEQTGSYSGQITGSLVGTLLIVMFMTLGILFSNTFFIFPLIKSSAISFISILRSFFIPPYNAPEIEFKPPNQPTINPDNDISYSLAVGISTLILIMIFSKIAEWLGQLEKLVEAHAHLIWYLQDLIAGDPETAIDGWVGAIEQIVVILDPILLLLHLTILFLTVSFAMSWIYLTRKVIEKSRVHMGLSRMGITAITNTIAIPSLILAWIVVDHILFIIWAVISLAFI